MRINKQKIRNKKWVIVCGLLALLTLCGLAAYYLISPANPNSDPLPKLTNDVNYDKPTDEQKSAGYEAKKQSLEPESIESEKSNANITITSLNQTDGMVMIRTVIDSTDSGGVCSLNMTKSGAVTISREAELQGYNSYSVCKGFDIPVSDLTKGTWKITITYSNNGTSVTASKDLAIL